MNLFSVFSPRCGLSRRRHRRSGESRFRRWLSHENHERAKAEGEGIEDARMALGKLHFGSTQFGTTNNSAFHRVREKERTS